MEIAGLVLARDRGGIERYEELVEMLELWLGWGGREWERDHNFVGVFGGWFASLVDVAPLLSGARVEYVTGCGVAGASW